MASSSPPKWWTHDVFLSFRGEDTRKNFVDHLYSALKDKGIFTFKDDETLPRGRSVGPELLRGIEQSRFSIVVFSENYADSSWCLDELVKIIDCKKSNGLTVLPVFYYVDPSEVRHQKGYFGKAFSKHEINGKKDQVQLQNWRSALTEAASVSGWDVPNTANGHQSQCIKQIVGKILMVLGDVISSTFASSLIGIQSRVQRVKSLLLEGGEDDVRMVGIWGMGGAGKTTLATAVYNDISNQFDGRCLVENVTALSLPSLQERVLSDCFVAENLKISNFNTGINMMSRLCNKKVLIVLDNVDNVKQLEAVIEKHDWFGKGSVIIITTRDKHPLVVYKVKTIPANLLNNDESLLLFQKHAFTHDTPQEEYADLARAVVDKVGGLPLALKILGSSLCGRSIIEWEDVLNKLMKHEPNEEILDVLKISYDGLDRNEKEIFLDIACFFLGWNGNSIPKWMKDDTLEELAIYGFNPYIGLSVLIEKCFVEDIGGTLKMHDMMKELALDIELQKDPRDPAKRSRVWLEKDIRAVLENNKESESIEGIIITPFMNPLKNFKGVKNLKKLRLIYVDDYMSPGYGPESGPEYLSDELRVIRWSRYPSQSLPPSFRANKLVILEMGCSKIVRLWKGRKVLDMLKSVDLSGSYRLTETPDFSAAPNLESLNLHRCINLKYVHPSLGNLQRLTFLDLSYCSSLERFSCGFNMTSLEILKLDDCNELKVFPQFVGDIKGLKELHLARTAIVKVHPSIDNLTGLVLLDLSSCINLKCLPSTIGHLKRLETLNLSDCPCLVELPKTLAQMESLKKLDLSWNPIKQPPASIVLLKNLNSLPIPDILCQLSTLKELYLRGCKELKILPKLPSLLAKLVMDGCESLESLGDLLTTKHKYLHIVSLKDCFKFSGNEKRHDCGVAEILIPAMPQGLYVELSRIIFRFLSGLRQIVKQYEFSIILPGHRISDWISTKLVMDVETPSLQFKLLPDWDRSIAGFAMTCDSLHNILAPKPVIVSLGRSRYFLYHSECRMIDRNVPHVWVGYISVNYLGKLIFGDAYKTGDDWARLSEASFLDINYNEPSWLGRNGRKYGIRVVYKEYLKHIYDQDDKEDDHISLPINHDGNLEGFCAFKD